MARREAFVITPIVLNARKLFRSKMNPIKCTSCGWEGAFNSDLVRVCQKCGGIGPFVPADETCKCGSNETWFDRTVTLKPDGTEDGMKTRCVGCGEAVKPPSYPHQGNPHSVTYTGDIEDFHHFRKEQEQKDNQCPQ